MATAKSDSVSSGIFQKIIMNSRQIILLYGRFI